MEAPTTSMVPVSGSSDKRSGRVGTAKEYLVSIARVSLVRITSGDVTIRRSDGEGTSKSEILSSVNGEGSSRSMVSDHSLFPDGLMDLVASAVVMERVVARISVNIGDALAEDLGTIGLC